MSRPTSQTSSVVGTTTNGPSRSLSLKTNTKTTFNNPLPPSDVKLFVTNLRLLDLDLRPDWPNITVQAFSSKNADQKQRMGAVEWGLFRLFELWDPVETSQKLQPFFPPLEPLQAKNLRNALYRSLDTLKKDGILGREVVLRKTMLEECKGEKFFDVLASFSGMVLKKVLASRPKDKGTTAVVRKLATATTLSSEQQHSLLPLAIAHKAALVNILKKKDEKRRRFTEFEALLDTKAGEINRRIRKCKETPRARKPAIPQKEADALKKQLKENWIGNPKWLDVMLKGDDMQAEDAFLTNSFHKVWHMVERGRRPDDAVPETGLLESLQLRVEEQQARLQRWQDFHDEMRKVDSTPSAAPAKAPMPTIEIRFDDHLKLQLRPEIPDDEPVKRPPLRPEYHEIVSELDDELAHIATRQHKHSAMPQVRRRGSSLNARSPARRRKSRSDSIPQVSASPPKIAKPLPPSRKQSYKAPPARAPQSYEVAVATPADSEATLIGQPSTLRTAPPTSHSVESPIEHHREPQQEEPTSDPLPTATSPARVHRAIEPPSPSPSPSPPPSSYFPSEPPVLEPPSLNDTNEEALAARIVSTIGDATPSPVKKPQPRLSLTERTRLTMAPHTFTTIPESPSLPSPPLPSPPPPPPDPQQQERDRKADLFERTRLSMAAMTTRRASLVPTQARDREKRKSAARQSIYPVNQFDTPRTRKSFMAIEEARSSGQKTPKEDLFSDEVDYERVFKSRPRIATSPVWGTPDVKGEDELDEGVTGVDLADVDNEEDGEVTVAWENSPLRGAGRRAGFN
ncbi:hypothetical protein K458DRAFT_302494 [Lentithecium fluviatile CBS 122367]|uniref:HAUS augmin-like complex subunit 6 N-terminal domain-containing protein n=1 Tax=Lentithecium fluviatile CBS 122367 TaxID=1168545 RepID=A0A6G1J1F0_9PLEO|nr:hypothetical protein K458DRAFT_302494 [Lentithecium fluviatile CBS 122367]